MLFVYGKKSLIKMIAIVLSFNLFALPILLQAVETNSIIVQQEEEDYQMICATAEADAEEDEGGATGYGIGGFLCGIFGWLFATISKPKPPASRLVGKSETYVAAYSDCYEAKAKSIRTHAACMGWVAGAVVSLLILSLGGTSTK